MKLRCVCVLGTLLLLQEPASARLQPTNGALQEEFTQIWGIRELRDGRILVSDRGDNRIVVGDFRSGHVEAVGRNGDGPGEYGIVWALHALGGDSTLMADPMERRWLVMDGARIVSTLPPDAPVVNVAGGQVVLGGDALGHVIIPESAYVPKGITLTSHADSISIAQLSIATGRSDTIARVLEMPMRRTVSRFANGDISSVLNVPTRPYALDEPATLCTDGWLAVVRFDPYRVDWRAPSGAWTHGQPLAVRAIPMTSREKRGYMARMEASSGKPPRSPDVYPDWPATVPPVEKSGGTFATAICSRMGTLLVNRSKTVDHPDTQYDIIDRRGVRTGALAIPQNEHVFAFGAHSVYVVVTDNDDIQRVQRHPWP